MIDKLGPPPVEALSDLAWARVERGLWSRLDAEPEVVVPRTPTRRWLVAAGVLAAAIAIVVLAVGRDSEVPGVATHDVVPTRMVSGASPSELTLDDAHVTLDPESAVVVTRAPAATTAVLERGAAWFSIARRTTPFVVMAGDAVVTVVGTRFRVVRAGDHARVEVERGIVDVRFRGAEHRLTAGQTWSSEPVATAPAIVPPVDPPIEPPVAKPPVAPVKPITPPVAKPPPMTPPPSDARRTELERLAVLEVKDPGTAITGYLALAKGTDRWAELALFAAARLAADRRDPRARALLDSYLQRFPRSANADDARELLGHLKGPTR